MTSDADTESYFNGFGCPVTDHVLDLSANSTSDFVSHKTVRAPRVPYEADYASQASFL